MTEMVAASTQWERELSHRPGVYVVGSTAEVLNVIDEMVRDVDVSG